MKELIYNQTRIPKEKWRYGFRSSARTGCGWVAIYNALCILGQSPKPEELIRMLERQLPLIHGNAGTAPTGPALLLRKMGYRVVCTGDRKKFDALVQDADVCLLYYFWRNKWRIGSHFICLHEKDGRTVGYNTFSNSDGPDDYGPSLDAFLRRRGYFGCFLTAVYRPRDLRKSDGR